MAPPVDELLAFFEELSSPASGGQHPLTPQEQKIASRLLLEVTNRLRFMCDTGLKYLTLNRLSATLSGGETQRINLTRTLGSNLTASMYILDEPSIGLHPRDTSRLVRVLKNLRDLGNTVVVVEHEEVVMRAADHLIESLCHEALGVPEQAEESRVSARNIVDGRRDASRHQRTSSLLTWLDR